MAQEPTSTSNTTRGNGTSIERSTANSSDTGSTGSSDDAARGLGKSLANEASQVGTNLKNVAGNLADEAKKAADAGLSAQKGRVAEGLGSVADALRQTPNANPLIDKAADQLDTVSRYVQTANFSDIGRDLQSFARREPALFLGGAFALGLVAGRFLKASAPKMQPSGDASSPAPGTNDRPGVA